LSTVTAPEKAGVVSQAAPAAAPFAEAKLLSSTLVLLSVGHFAVDFYSSSVATLQPALAERYGLSLTQAGLIGGAFMLGSAVTQLFFGLISDRIHSRLFTVMGLVVAAVFFSIMGLAPGFNTLLLLILVGGMGVAAFHPQSTAQAVTGVGRRRGLALSIFLTSGMMGVSFGPAYFSYLVERLGFESLYWAAAPAVPVAAFLLWRLPPMRDKVQAKPPVDWSVFRKHGKTLSLHYSLVVLRSIVQLALGQFLTLYLYIERGFSLKEASLGLTLFFVGSAISAGIGGALADRIGGKPVVLISMISCVPFLALFLGTDGWLSFAGLFIGSLLLLMTNPVIVLMAQDLIPSQAGTASALMMGFGWGMAGITFIPFIGWLSDRMGLEAVLWGVILLPLLGFLMALKLPKTAHG
jgi:MFS transporter, FSR family, fosmidomycin resistance protein